LGSKGVGLLCLKYIPDKKIRGQAVVIKPLMKCALCGFVRCSQLTMMLNGEDVWFIEMELTKESFLAFHGEENEGMQ